MPNRRNAGIYTAEMGQPPKDVDMGSAPATKRAPISSGSKVRVAPTMPDESQRHYKGYANSSKQK
jgi:hypothetical protein